MCGCFRADWHAHQLSTTHVHTLTLFTEDLDYSCLPTCYHVEMELTSSPAVTLLHLRTLVGGVQSRTN